MKKANSLISATEIIGKRGEVGVEIKGLAFDSRQTKPGFVFFAVPGQNFDGSRFVQDAIERGAAMIVTSEPLSGTFGRVLFVQVADVRKAMAEISTAFYDYPARRLRMFGITGTNGKTTISHLINSILSAAGERPGVIGTIRYEIGARSIPASRTTPESVDLQNMLFQMANAGCKSAIMEVSSHGLVQKRVWGIDYDAAVFSNLTHDHLDYHQTVDEYYHAKSLLFSGLGGKADQVAVINIDDPHGASLPGMAENAKVFSYGIENPVASIRAVNLNLGVNGSSFDIESPWGVFPTRLRLLGRFNVYNALAAFTACAATGYNPTEIPNALSGMLTVPGRLEEIKTDAGFQVFIDYAHTEDALKNVLTAIREITHGRVILVFGCGGNRDKRKRPLMGIVASELADYSILTSDNPRKENPSEIISQVRAGFGSRDNFEQVEDRYEAIVRALSIANRDDVVLVAGKGHENYQEFADTVIPFDDRQVVRECMGIKS